MSTASATATDSGLAARLPTRGRMRAEVLIVLGLSLGQAAVYAAVRLIERYLQQVPIGDQSTTLNPSESQVDVIDLTLQVLRIGFSLMPVVLALFLLSQHGASWRARLGLVGPGRAWRGDLGWTAVLAASIGLPGLALYAISRALGATVRVDTSGLPDLWWSATILLMSAAAAGVLEEFVIVGFVLTRLRDLGRLPWTAIVIAALVRGAYHLYQGWPMALGNVAMGLVFGWVFVRRGRLAPLVLAHWTLDAVAFVGPEVVPAEWLDALGVT